MKKKLSCDAVCINNKHCWAQPYNRAYVKRFEGNRLGFSKMPHCWYYDYNPNSLQCKKFYRLLKRILESYCGKSYEELFAKVRKSTGWSTHDVKTMLERVGLFNRGFYRYHIENDIVCKYTRHQDTVQLSPEQLEWNFSHEPKNIVRASRGQATLGKYWYLYRENNETKIGFGTVLHQPLNRYRDMFEHVIKDLQDSFSPVQVPGLWLYWENTTLEPAVLKKTED